MYKTISINNKRLIQLSICLIILLGIDKAYAKTSYKNNSTQSYYQEGSWRLYPITIQMNLHGGPSMPVSLIRLPQEVPAVDLLLLSGVSADLSILYVKRSLWKHLDCYPRLGLTFNYHRLANEGNIYSGLFYIEPNYNHSTGSEFLPRLGIGVAYAQIPGHHPYDQPEDEPMPEVNDYMQGPALDLGLDMGIRFRLTHKWNMYAGLGINYLLAFTREGNQDNGELLPRKRLTLANLNISGSYTFNPHPDIFVRTQGPRKSRIDIGMLHSFTKANPRSPSQNQKDDTKASDDELYYLGGIYAQGSLQLFNNHALTLGSEWVKNRAATKETQGMVRDSNLQVGFLVGHEFLLEKLTFGQAVGFHAYNDAVTPPFGSLYTRLTLNYHLTKSLFFGTSAKTTLLPEKGKFVAFDYIDLRFGYSFDIKY
jgi:hypothetical protein